MEHYLTLKPFYWDIPTFQTNMRNTKNHIDGEVIKPEKSNSNKNNLQNLAAEAGVVFDVHTR